MVEEWKDIEGYEGWYQVSNLGRVKSVDRKIIYSNGKVYLQKGKMLKATVKKNGYHYVSLSKNNNKPNIDIHRLVAIAFLPNDNNLPVVNHKDCNKSNNNSSNLEWCTYSFNARHAIENGLIEFKCGENSNTSKLKNSDVIMIKKMLSEGVKGIEISRFFNVSPSTISEIKNNKKWAHI